MIDVREVDFSFGEQRVLEGITIAISRGEFMCLVGPNGSGKTTLVRLLSGYLKPASGSISIDGRAVADMTPVSLARYVAVVPQSEPAPFPITVRDAVALGRSPHSRGMGFESKADGERIAEALRACGLEELASRRVTTLSGGERHRVLIARALAQDTPVLLLDEPNAHLDLHHQKGLFELLARLNREQMKTIICVTHDLSIASAFAGTAAILTGGRIVAKGPVCDVLTVPAVREHFLVNAAMGPSGSVYVLWR
jgi:iron complex transport system ATP-binding protein